MRATFTLVWIAAILFLLSCAPAFAQPDANEFDRYIAMLKSEDAAERTEAVRELIEMRDPQAIEPLCALINDTECDWGGNIIWFIHQYPRELYWRPFLKAMSENNDADFEMWLSYFQEYYYPNKMPEMLQLIKDPHPRTRALLLKVLGAQDCRMEVIEGDDQTHYRELDDPANFLKVPATHKVVIDSLDDPSTEVRIAAIQTARWLVDGTDKAFNPSAQDIARVRRMFSVNTHHNDARVRKTTFLALFRLRWASLDEALAALREGSAELRLDAFSFATRFDDQRVRDLILRSITDSDPEMRQSAYVALIKLKDPPRARALAMEGLKDPSPVAREGAIYALWLNDGANHWMPELEPFLRITDVDEETGEDREEGVRETARRVLAVAKDRNHVDKYLEYFADSPSVLASLHDPRVVPLLVDMFRGDKPDNSWSNPLQNIRDALIMIGPVGSDAALEMLDDPLDWERLETAFYIAARYVPRQRLTDKLLEMAHGELADMRKRAYIFARRLYDDKSSRFLTTEDEKYNSELLAELIRRNDKTEEQFLLEALRRSGTPESRRMLLDKGKAAPPDKRYIFYQYMRKYTDQEPVDFLYECFANDKEHFVDELSKYPDNWGKGLCNDPRIIAGVLSSTPKKSDYYGNLSYYTVDEYHPWYLELSSWSIVKAITDPGSKQVFAELLRNNDPHVRLNAAYTLWRFDKKAATAELLPYLDSDDTQNYLMAVRALAEMGDRRALPELLYLVKELPAEFEEFNNFIRQIPDCATDPVSALSTAFSILKQRNYDYLMKEPYFYGYHFECEQYEIIHLLGKLRSNRADNALVELSKDRYPKFALLALQCLHEKNYPQIFDVLIAALEHPSEQVCRSAAAMLRKLCDGRALSALRRATRRQACRSTILRARIALNDQAAIGEALRLLDPEHLDEDTIAMLGESHDPRAFAPLMAIYERALIMRKLGAPIISSHPAVKRNWVVDSYTGSPLAGTLNDELYFTLIRALGELGDRRAIKPLRRGKEFLKHIERSLDEYDNALAKLEK